MLFSLIIEDMVATLRKKMNSTERDRLDASAKANEEVAITVESLSRYSPQRCS